MTVPVMLSGALQRNAKHEARLSNISDYFLTSQRTQSRNDWRFFAPLRMTTVLSMRPGSPAFADRFGVIVDVDLLQAANAAPNCVGGVLILFPDQFEERPEEGQRKHAPMPAERRLQFDVFSVVRSRGVTNRETDRESDGQRAENRGHGIFAQEKLRSLAGNARFRSCLFPRIAGRN